MQKTKPGYKKVKWLFRKDIEIPEEWEKTTVGEHTFILVGNAFPSKEYSENLKDMRLLRGDNVTEGRVRWGEKTRYWSNYSEFKKFQLLENDFVISMDGSKVGKNYAYVKKLDLPCLLVQRVACLRSKSTLIQKYFGHIFGNKNFINYVNSVRTNSGIPHISTKDIQNFSLLLPPLPEQQKIAAILSNVDELISSYDKTIESTKKLKKGLMQTLLTKGIGHKKFKELTIIPRFIEFSPPEEWKISSLSELSEEIKDGPMGFGLHTYDYVETGIPVLRIQNLKNLEVTKNELRFISQEKHEELKKSQVNPLDIIISKTGILGVIGIIPKDYGPANLNQALARITLKDKESVFYVALFLASKTPQQILNVVGSGRTVQAGLKLSDIKNLEIPIPSKKEQKQIISIYKSINNEITKLELKKKSAESLKKGLMQKLLTGQIRVKV